MTHADDPFAQIRSETEAVWRNATIRDDIYGFQIQPGTTWLPGLGDELIDQFEHVLDTTFPHDFRQYLGRMNGTSQPAINVYGNSGTPFGYKAAIYSYPRDIDSVVRQRDSIYEAFEITAADVRERGLPSIIPLYDHRCLMTLDGRDLGVLSIFRDDVVHYGNSLVSYLRHEFLGAKPSEDPLPVPFWYEP